MTFSEMIEQAPETNYKRYTVFLYDRVVYTTVFKITTDDEIVREVGRDRFCGMMNSALSRGMF